MKLASLEGLDGSAGLGSLTALLTAAGTAAATNPTVQRMAKNVVKKGTSKIIDRVKKKAPSIPTTQSSGTFSRMKQQAVSTAMQRSRTPVYTAQNNTARNLLIGGAILGGALLLLRGK